MSYSSPPHLHAIESVPVSRPTPRPVGPSTATRATSLPLRSQSTSTSTKESGRYDGEGETPWMDLVDAKEWDGLTSQEKSVHLVTLLDYELLAFASWIRPSHDDHAFRLGVARRIDEVVQRVWTDGEARAVVFGSTAAGLYTPSADIDIVVTVPDHARQLQDTTVTLDVLRTAFDRAGLAPRLSIELVQAKVPLLKMRTTPEFGSFKVDVSLEHARDGPLGAEACLKALWDLDHRSESTMAAVGGSGGGGARPVDKTRSERAKGLLMVVKMLLEVNGLNASSTKGLGGMATFCLVVSFCQASLPPVPSSLSACVDESYDMPVVPQQDQRRRDECSPSKDLLDFLDYVDLLDFATRAISIVDGGRILAKVDEAWARGDLDRLCIQHPVELTRNLASNTTRLADLSRAFGSALSALESYLFDRRPLRRQSILEDLFKFRFGVEEQAVRERNRRLSTKPFADLPKDLMMPPTVRSRGYEARYGGALRHKGAGRVLDPAVVEAVDDLEPHF
ncbi:hypothetical protein JCM10212_003812 [Sporobolomyces blumeae]